MTSTPSHNELSHQQIEELFELTASRAELDELFKKHKLLQEPIKQATNTMISNLKALITPSPDYLINEKDFRGEVQSILLDYKTECDKIAGHNTDVLKKVVYISIITIAAALLGMALAATFCTAIGIVGAAATLGIVGGFAAGAALGYASSTIHFFAPNKVQRAVNKVADEAEKEALTPANMIFTQ